MSDDDQDDTLRNQFQQLQNQQQRRLQILQKRRQEKARQSSMETMSNGSGPAFGIVDDLDLKTNENDIYRQDFDRQSNREIDQLNEEIRELKDETGRLYKLLNERDLELRNARRKLDDFQALQSAGVTGDGAAATKIVELSKKVRELTAELEAERTRSKQLARRCMEAEKLASQFPTSGSDDPRGVVPLNESQTGTPEDARSLQDKLRQAELKAAEHRNQIQSLKAELKVTQKVLAQEVGEGVQVQSLINGSSGWRGRAQQIAALQKKVGDLKKQLEPYKQLDSSSGMTDIDQDEFLTHRAGARAADDKQKEKLKQMEQKKKEAQEKIAADMKALEQENESLKQKADAAKARITILKNENQTHKQQIQTLLDKGRHDDELIEALFKQQSQLKQALEESSKTVKQRTEEMHLTKQELSIKQQQDGNVVEQLKAIVIEKESKIRTLERQVRELQADINIERRHQRNVEEDDQESQSVREMAGSPADNIRPEVAARIISEVLSPTPGQRSDRRSYSRADIERELARTSNIHLPYRYSVSNGQNELKHQEISTLYQALTVERDRLSELVKVLEKRIQEATYKVAESLTELQAQRRQNALLEKQIGKASMDKKSKTKTNTAQANVKATSLEELETKLEIQRDENEALKAALQSTLKAKEDDLKMYMDSLEETKKVFLQGIQKIKLNSPQA